MPEAESWTKQLQVAQMRFNILAMGYIIIFLLFLELRTKIDPVIKPIYSPDVCTVVQEIDQQTAECQFPFVYKGIVFYDCTTFDDEDNKSWCSTKVDSQTTHEEGYWGYCSDPCHKYKYNNNSYNLQAVCPMKLSVHDFAVNEFNGIYIMSEFAVINNNIFYVQDIDESPECIWFLQQSGSWMIGNCSSNGRTYGYATLLQQLCPTQSQDLWRDAETLEFVSGGCDQYINPPSSSVPPPVIYWKNSTNVTWANGCNFQGSPSKSTVIKSSLCADFCLQNKGCTHFDWDTFDTGTCRIKEGNVTVKNAIYSSNYFTMCGLLNIPN